MKVKFFTFLVQFFSRFLLIHIFVPYFVYYVFNQIRVTFLSNFLNLNGQLVKASPKRPGPWRIQREARAASRENILLFYCIISAVYLRKKNRFVSGQI